MGRTSSENSLRGWHLVIFRVDQSKKITLYIRFLIMMVFGSEDVEQLSGKIDSIKLNEHVPSLSDCVNLALDIQHQAYGQVICSTCYAF